MKERLLEMKFWEILVFRKLVRRGKLLRNWGWGFKEVGDELKINYVLEIKEEGV